MIFHQILLTIIVILNTVLIFGILAVLEKGKIKIDYTLKELFKKND